MKKLKSISKTHQCTLISCTGGTDNSLYCATDACIHTCPLETGDASLITP